MAIKERIARLEKSGGLDNFSLIPRQERLVVAAGYTESEREAKMKVRLAELHEKYGEFDENSIMRILIRKFCRPKV